MSMTEFSLSELHQSDEWIAEITADRIAAALEEFPLSLAEGWDFERLAKVIQGKINVAREQPCQGNAAAIAELKRLAARAAALQQDLISMGATAELAAYWEVFRHLEAARGAQQIDLDNDYKPFMIQPLQSIANVLARAASQIGTEPRQAPGWRMKAKQDRRVALAVAFTSTFQECFGAPVVAYNWAADYGTELPWPLFYRRIYTELFPDDEHLNLSEVLQEAAREYPKVEEMIRYLDEQDATLLKTQRE